ncbi:hypothetical protein MASR2M8_09880 [Opitutaceae bacterium]
MAKTTFPTNRSKVLLFWVAYGLVVAWFLWIVSQFYIPGKGFTYLVMFGDQRSADYLPELRATDHYEMENSFGYDAQHYAQIAMRPALDDPELGQAVDNLPYRARRILLSWAAYVLAGGDGVRALHIFAFQNVVCWCALAIVLLRWFPPNGLNNFIRWAGVLLSFGMCLSVRGALVDGPSLLFIAIAVLLYEQGKSWWSALIMAIAGLGKETNILAGSLLLDPSARGWRRWLVISAQGALVLAPLALWVLYLTLSLGSDGGTGSRNFDQPFVAYIAKWQETLNQIEVEGAASVAKWSLMMLIALTVQLTYFLVRPQWRQPWWRVGISYSVLMIVLGDAVWEGYPGAASRVLLPLTLAFNVLLPRGRWWLVPLLLGNLTVFTIFDSLKPPTLSYRIEGERSLRVEAATGRPVEVTFDDNWYLPERTRLEYWRWNSGSSRITLRNPHEVALTVDISFQLRSNTDRIVTVKAGEVPLWTGPVEYGQAPEVMLAGYRLEPGETTWLLESDQPAVGADAQDLRMVAFNLRNLTLRIRGVAP